MSNAATGETGFWKNRFLQILIGIYLVIWIVLAIHPLDRKDWLLENLLVFASTGVLAFTYRRFVFFQSFVFAHRCLYGAPCRRRALQLCTSAVWLLAATYIFITKKSL